MKRLLRALAAWRGRALPPQGATAIRQAARDSAFSVVELLELQHAMEAAEQPVDKANFLSSVLQSSLTSRPLDASPEVETDAGAFPRPRPAI
jgi:hypothetical protein